MLKKVYQVMLGSIVLVGEAAGSTYHLPLPDQREVRRVDMPSEYWQALSEHVLIPNSQYPIATGVDGKRCFVSSVLLFDSDGLDVDENDIDQFHDAGKSHARITGFSNAYLKGSFEPVAIPYLYAKTLCDRLAAKNENLSCITLSVTNEGIPPQEMDATVSLEQDMSQLVSESRERCEPGVMVEGIPSLTGESYAPPFFFPLPFSEFDEFEY